jgi:hypothetical protein
MVEDKLRGIRTQTRTQLSNQSRARWSKCHNLMVTLQQEVTRDMMPIGTHRLDRRKATASGAFAETQLMYETHVVQVTKPL